MNFENVRPIEGSVRTGFEELCVQLDEAICGGPLRGRVRVDGAGGDGGVELFGTTPDGRKVGLQAKHFFKRLGKSQWDQIKGSVATAMRNHPDLKQYFVCVALDRTPGEKDKWAKQEAEWAKSHPELTVTWVGKSELIGYLTQERWAYLAVYWLNAPDFTLKRVRDKTDVAIKQLHHRFSPALHHRTDAENSLGHLLAFPDAREVHRQACVKLATEVHGLLDAIADATWTELEASHAAQRNAATDACGVILETIADGVLTEQSAPFEAALGEGLRMLRELQTALSDARYRAREAGSEAKVAGTVTLLRAVPGLLRQAESVMHAIGRYNKALTQACWLLTGEAGNGKSHLLATVVRRAAEEGSAALMFLGEQFQGDGPISLQICEQFSWSREFSELLACLQARAQSAKRPSLIVIDAINETPNRSLWLNQLVSLESDIAKFPDVRLVISCREDWLNSCVPKAVAKEAARVWHHGYTLDFQEVVTAYFRGYNVQSDSFPALIPEFRNPLFLKTVCEAYRDKKLPARPLSFVRVLEAWEKRIAEEISKAIDCSPTVTGEAISGVVSEMARTSNSRVPSSFVRKLCMDLFPVPQEKAGLYKQLQTQGFMHEVGKEAESFIRLQYERFYDVRVVQSELATFATVDDFRAYWSETLLPRIGQYGKDEILESRMFAYALLVPERYGIELPILPMPPRHKEYGEPGASKVWQGWISALAWRQIPESRDEIRRLFVKWTQFKFRTSHFTAFFTFACIEDHPLNADFLHAWLSKCELVDRELYWTVPMANQDTEAEDANLDGLIRWCDGARNMCSNEQARLAATMLLWLTSTSNSSDRDKATEAAIRLLAGKAAASLELLDMFWDVNDPYVKERLLAVLAGVAPTLVDAGLTRLASKVAKRFFRSGDVPQHIMQRDYARFIVEFANRRGLVDPEDLEASHPPYKSKPLHIWSEEEVAAYEKDRAYSTIAGSLAPEEMGPGLYGDFGRYVMGNAVHSFVDPVPKPAKKKPHELEYKREDARIARRYLWRRIIQMGWTPERFGDFEDNLFSSGRDRAPVERISKKFQWIGLYEYLGHLMDHSGYMEYGDDAPRADARVSDLTMRNFNPSTAEFGVAVAAASSQELPVNPVPKMQSMQERVDWAFGESDSFLPYLHRKIDGAPRLVLSAHVSQSEVLPIGRARSNTDHASQWVDVRSFLVHEDKIDALAQSLKKRDFWGKGVELPRAYACWLSEFPWDKTLRPVRASLAKGGHWLELPKGIAEGTACSLDTEEHQFVMPAPAMLERLSSSIGNLTSPTPLFDSTYVIRNKVGSGVFWGSTRRTLLAVDYAIFAAWLREQRLALMWCCLRERSVSSGQHRVSLVAESTQSSIVVLRPYQAPVELEAERKNLFFEKSEKGAVPMRQPKPNPGVKVTVHRL